MKVKIKYYKKKKIGKDEYALIPVIDEDGETTKKLEKLEKDNFEKRKKYQFLKKKISEKTEMFSPQIRSDIQDEVWGIK